MSKYQPSPVVVMLKLRLEQFIAEMNHIGLDDEFIAKVLIRKGEKMQEEISKNGD